VPNNLTNRKEKKEDWKEWERIKRDKSIKIVTEKKIRDIATGKARLNAVMVERKYPTNCMAAPARPSLLRLN